MAEFLYSNFPNINWGNLHFISTADLIVRGIMFPLLAVVIVVVIVKMVKDFKNAPSDTEWEYEQEESNNG